MNLIKKHSYKVIYEDLMNYLFATCGTREKVRDILRQANRRYTLCPMFDLYRDGKIETSPLEAEICILLNAVRI